MDADAKAILNTVTTWLVDNLALGQENSWVLSVFVVILTTAIIALFVKKFFFKLAQQLLRTRNVWDDLLVEAARRPAVMLVWVLGGSWAIDIIDAKTGTVLLDIIDPLRKVAVIVLIGWFLVRFVKRAETALIDPQGIDTSMDETTVSAIGKLIRLALVVTIALVVLQSFGYSVSGVLAFGGIGGLAVGFAAKDLLANFFGGLMIYLDRPFKVGDWVRSPDQNIEGTVEDIGWRLTRIRTFEQRPLYVPNATFTSISVENPSRMKNRRIYETVGVRYCDVARIQAIVSDVKTMLQNHPEIDTRQTLIVNLNQFSPSSLDFFVYTFTKTTNWVKYHNVKQDVLLQIMAIVEGHDAEVAFPTQTLHVEGISQAQASLELANIQQ